MQRRPLLALAVFSPLGTMLVAPAFAAAAGVGQAAPDFTLTDTAGKPVRLSDFKGKTVVLEWNNPGCPFVRKHYQGNMQALQKEATGQGVTWLTIISSAPGTQGHVSAGQADELTAQRKAGPTAVLLDPTGTVGQLYGATNTPHMYVIDKAGTLVYAGAIDDRPTSRRSDVQGANNYVRAALQSVAAGQPIKTPITRAYGCTVKYS
jgi:peroxiredoxin